MSDVRVGRSAHQPILNAHPGLCPGDMQIKRSYLLGEEPKLIGGSRQGTTEGPVSALCSFRSQWLGFLTHHRSFFNVINPSG